MQIAISFGLYTHIHLDSRRDYTIIPISTLYILRKQTMRSRCAYSQSRKLNKSLAHHQRSLSSLTAHTHMHVSQSYCKVTHLPNFRRVHTESSRQVSPLRFPLYFFLSRAADFFITISYVYTYTRLCTTISPLSLSHGSDV